MHCQGETIRLPVVGDIGRSVPDLVGRDDHAATTQNRGRNPGVKDAAKLAPIDDQENNVLASNGKRFANVSRPKRRKRWIVLNRVGGDRAS